MILFSKHLPDTPEYPCPVTLSKSEFCPLDCSNCSKKLILKFWIYWINRNRSKGNNFRKHEKFCLWQHSQQYQVVWPVHWSENFLAWKDGWYWYENPVWKQSAENAEISCNIDIWITAYTLSSRWSRKENTGQFKWKLTHLQEAQVQKLLLPSASYSGQFTYLALASSVWCISERRRQIQAQIQPVHFRGGFDSDWHSKISPSNELKTESNLVLVILPGILELLTGLYSETAACHHI